MFKVQNVKKKRMVKLFLYLKNKKMVLCKLLIVFEQKTPLKVLKGNGFLLTRKMIELALVEQRSHVPISTRVFNDL